MYHPFFQFFLPRVGQAALAGLLYWNFLQLPPLQWLAPWPLLYYGAPLALVAVLAWLARDPLGLGVVLAGYLTALYCAGNLLGLTARLLGGPVWTAWQVLWLEGLTPWLLTALIWWWGRRQALNLRTTRYRLTTSKALPGGRLTIVQISDIHPNPKAAMHRGRIPELRQKIEACKPDLLVLTGDIFDEFTEPEEFEAFARLFAELKAPLGKYYVLGNHDLFHHWREPSFDRAALQTALAEAGVTLLEDASVLTGGIRVVGRKDYLYTQGRRCSAGELLPGGPDDHYTLWLDHEPRDFKRAAAAGADLILSGHTHGGQVWPAGAVGMAARNERNYGKKQVTPGCTAIVSGGTGTWGYRFRTQGRTEIVCIEVESTAPEKT
ncbi:metallophosphoesterase [Subdoligranulum sp. DSM 109015]|uniref:Metallophosphoesterase n=1 Tax=Gemmiger gallinarum TaxID=2779354 RepID=A0ABR9R635_9FIRM|nr:metallophosphoesterase [Gemmiger gallinarum]MBE5038596.1 metallophosphoesterase [Gemmiger gallinarum]